MEKRKRIIGVLLIITILSTLLPDRFSINAAPQRTDKVHSIKGQNIIVIAYDPQIVSDEYEWNYGGISYGYQYMNTSLLYQYGAGKNHTVNEDWTGKTADELAVAEISDETYYDADVVPIYCLQYSKSVPDNELSSTKWLMESDFYNQDIKGKLQSVMKYGYPANEEYWKQRGIGDSAVMQAITQFAIWYITSDRDNYSQEFLTVHQGLLGPDDESLMIYLDNFVKGYKNGSFDMKTGPGDAKGSLVINPQLMGGNVYRKTDWESAMGMLYDMLMVTENYPSYVPNGANTYVEAVPLTNVSEYEDGGYNYYFRIKGENIDSSYADYSEVGVKEGGLNLKLTDEHGKLLENCQVYTAIGGNGDFRQADYINRGNVNNIKIWHASTIDNKVYKNGENVSDRSPDIFVKVRLEALQDVMATAYTCKDSEKELYYYTPDESDRQIILRASVQRNALESKALIVAKKVSFNIVKLGKNKEGAVIDTKLAGALFGIYASKEDAVNKTNPIKTVTTDANGLAVVFDKENADGTYYIRELSAPDGYVIDDSIQMVLIRGEDVTTTIANTARQLRLRITKSAPVLSGFDRAEFVYTKEALSNVRYEIYDDKECLHCVDSIVTDENGQAVSRNLMAGIYYVKEVTAPNGYIADTSVHTVNLKYPDDNSVVSYVDIPFVNDREQYLVKVNKTAETSNKPLSGAVFTLFADKDIVSPAGRVIAKAGEELAKAQSDADGVALFDSINLPYGYSFVIKETQAPKGYALSEETVIVNTVNDGTWTYENNIFTRSITITDKEVFGKLEIHKKGEVLTAYSDGKFVYEERNVEATFGVYADKDCLVEVTRITTGADGVGISKELALGTYYVKELVAAKNCVLDSKIYEVTLRQDNPVQSVVKETLDFYNRRKDIDINVFKHTADTKEPIKGTVFSVEVEGAIRDYRGNVLVGEAGKRTILAELITDEKGYAFLNIELPTGYTYIVREVLSAQGYVLSTDEYRIEEGWKNEAVPYAKYSFDVTNKKQLGQIIIKKSGEVLTDVVFENGRVKSFVFEERFLKDAVFGVYSDAACTDIIAKLVTDSDGEARTDMLSLGKYYIKELTAPVGCVLDGRVYEAELKYGDMTKEVVFETLSLNNKKTGLNIAVRKQDADTKAPLENAVFEIVADCDIYDYTGKKLLVNEGEVLQTFTSDKEGMAKVTIPLPVNVQYKVLEKTAPAGYVLNSSPYIIDAAWSNTESEVLTFTYTKENAKQRGKIEVLKQGEVLTGFVNGKFMYSKEYVPGAVFGIYYDRECQRSVETITTDTSGKAVSSEVPLGKYYVKELVAPYGCVLDTTVYEVVLSYAGQNKTLAIKSIGITDERQKLKLDIDKLDKNTKEPISGAVFGLYAGEDILDYKGNCLVEKGILLEEMVSDTNGKVTTSLDLPHGKYTVKEHAGAQGYVCDNVVREYEQKYNAGKTAEKCLVIKDTITNDKTNILIAKKDSTGIKEQLSGAVFEVRTRSGEAVCSFVTGKEPAVLTGITPGEYLLVETKAPYGFEISPPIIMEIKNTAKVQYFEVTDKAIIGDISFEYDATGDKLYMPNAGAQIEVPKTGDESNAGIYALILLLSIGVMALMKSKKLRMIPVFMVLMGFMLTCTVKASEPEKIITVESDVIYGDERATEFENEVTIAGNRYILKDVIEVPLNALTERFKDIKETVTYKGYVELGDDKGIMTVNIYDELLRASKKKELSAADISVVKTYWKEDFEFEIDVVIKGLYFSVGDSILEYRESTPGLLEYSDYLLEKLNLSKDKYIIDSIQWKGKMYEKDGVKHRTAIAKGKRRLNDYMVTYEGRVALDDVTNVRKYIATYELAVPKETSVQQTQSVTERITESSTQTVTEPVTGKVKGKSFEGIYVFVLVLALLILVAISSLICYNVNKKVRTGKGEANAKKGNHKRTS